MSGNLPFSSFSCLFPLQSQNLVIWPSAYFLQFRLEEAHSTHPFCRLLIHPGTPVYLNKERDFLDPRLFFHSQSQKVGKVASGRSLGLPRPSTPGNSSRGRG